MTDARPASAPAVLFADLLALTGSGLASAEEVLAAAKRRLEEVGRGP